MRGKKAKAIRRMLFKAGISINPEPYSVKTVTCIKEYKDEDGNKQTVSVERDIISASKGRKLYQQIKRAGT